MKSQLGINIRHFDKIYPIDNINFNIQINQHIVVDTSRGIECGIVKPRCKCAKKQRFELKINKIIRIADAADIKKLEALEGKESSALTIGMTKVEELNLPMRFVRVEYLFDDSKAIFYYKQNDENDKNGARKLNLSELIRQLASVLRIRLEMRQVGPRGEAKILGGVGNCGRGLCCSTWLTKSKPVTIKMAKEQSMSINIPKLSGVCGRLMCCLRYERQNYQEGVLIAADKEISGNYEEIFESGEEVVNE
ncbi:MAG: stage 0 sporulation protein [Candidatus Margulisiibacteriota bacterium]|nr:MAG: hypothetical protein A2X43_09190 [Candidatus Margulisbacteria bacterium GWD2_39_127]OGI03596.1 MAG: hypothetical protein A2X42_01030 [Candidatus Margulisbacteria bacterium GWF2_38_17]OGI11100.1 MAG: hypothetical protein A2X41_02325 [Candidatus Margulisbacteria bacterium GWE2_39_32]PZM78152.1 MAG: stage 0 sporulation protein [Candidatus Margulisiibacteriota bacterium]HAR62300.1 stage 0 sporulation protein [Candidatus Margulisiibacteriota bacterium]